MRGQHNGNALHLRTICRNNCDTELRPMAINTSGAQLPAIVPARSQPKNACKRNCIPAAMIRTNVEKSKNHMASPQPDTLGQILNRFRRCFHKPQPWLLISGQEQATMPSRHWMIFSNASAVFGFHVINGGRIVVGYRASSPRGRGLVPPHHQPK